MIKFTHKQVARLRVMLDAYEQGRLNLQLPDDPYLERMDVETYVVKLTSTVGTATISGGEVTPANGTAKIYRKGILTSSTLNNAGLAAVTVYNIQPYSTYYTDTFNVVIKDPYSGALILTSPPLPQIQNVIVKTNGAIAEGTTNAVRTVDATLQTTSGNWFANATADSWGRYLGLIPESGPDPGHVLMYHWYRSEIVSGSYVQCIWMYNHWYSNGLDCLVS